MATKLIMKRKRQQDEVRCYNEITNQNATEHGNGNENAKIEQFLATTAHENYAENCQLKRSKLMESTALQAPLHIGQHEADKAATETSTPPPPPPPSSTTNAPSNNHILMEALQKIIELQAELDAFEHDLDESDYNDDAEVSFYLEDEHVQQQARMQAQQDTDEYRRHEAEALGFAMCARETMLFLQREGISSDSVLYRSLHQRLVGQSDDVIPI